MSISIMILCFLLYRPHNVAYTNVWLQCLFTVDRTELLRVQGKVSQIIFQLLTNYDTNGPSKQPPMLTTVSTTVLKLKQFPNNSTNSCITELTTFFPPALLQASNDFQLLGERIC
jgi:hypothetical protein